MSRAAWRNTMIAATILWLLIALVGFGADKAFGARSARVQHAMQAIAGRTIALDCTYATVGGAPAESFPAGGPTSSLPSTFAKPWVCAQARAFALRPDARDSGALLVLTHEALHLRVWPGYNNEQTVECEALREVGRFAMMLGAPAALVPSIVAAALLVHAAAWPFTCQ